MAEQFPKDPFDPTGSVLWVGGIFMLGVLVALLAVHALAAVPAVGTVLGVYDGMF